MLTSKTPNYAGARGRRVFIVFHLIDITSLTFREIPNSKREIGNFILKMLAGRISKKTVNAGRIETFFSNLNFT